VSPLRHGHRTKTLYLAERPEPALSYAICTMTQGRLSFQSQSVLIRVWRERRADPTRVGRRDPLSAFERRLLELLASGLNRQQIAGLVHRSPQTISNSLTVDKEKLGASSLTQAAVLIAYRRFRGLRPRRPSTR